ncbi:PREDICTED: epsin-1 [Myotis davidii]|uniref:epsin-1 n=1 Tax=Myotis davidii TaxID=225400 RepID=UPI00076799EC|nr:PREDICTED: epsin-1 [Myotis davidii]
MSTSSLRRQMKNIVHNYSEAEIKVREATSNDPWGPSSSLMSEIADLTYNVVAFSEIMSMIWKRLNDHGKNWRHVYKVSARGSGGLGWDDQGVNVRERRAQRVALLRDEDRLREERAHALKTKEKLAQTATARPPLTLSLPQPPSCGPEDDVQLQLALSLSREEHDKEERIRRGDDLRLQMAIEESKRETGGQEESSLMDLADVFTAPAPPTASDPWGGPAPMATAIPTATPASDPWPGPPHAPHGASSGSPGPLSPAGLCFPDLSSRVGMRELSSGPSPTPGPRWVQGGWAGRGGGGSSVRSVSLLPPLTPPSLLCSSGRRGPARGRAGVAAEQRGGGAAAAAGLGHEQGGGRPGAGSTVFPQSVGERLWFGFVCGPCGPSCSAAGPLGLPVCLSQH